MGTGSVVRSGPPLAKLAGGGQPELLFKEKNKRCFGNTVKVSFQPNLFYISLSLSLEKQFNVEIASSTNRPMTALKGKLLKVVLLLVIYLWFLFVCLFLRQGLTI